MAAREFSHISRTVPVLLSVTLCIVLAVWLLAPYNVALADPDPFDGREQEEPLESDARNPGPDSYRAKRQFF